MNWLDFVLAIILLISVANGWRKGLIRIGIGIIATVAAIVLSCWFYGSAGVIFLPYVTGKAMANVLGFMTVFLGVITVGAIVSRILAAIFKWVGLSWFDRLMGAAFGVVRGVMMSTAVIMVIMGLSHDSPPKSIANSEIAPYLTEAAEVFSFVAPKEFKKGFQENYEKVKKTWSDTFRNSIRKLPSQKE